MTEKSYTISICTEPEDVATPKSWRKRVRRMIRHELDEEWGLFKDLASDGVGGSGVEDELLGRWEALEDARREFLNHLKTRTQDLVGTPLEYHAGDLTIDTTKRDVKLVWTTAKAHDTKREAQKSSARLLQKILRMKRHRNPPPEWERYLRLRQQWPAKASSFMPLPDPDTVIKNRPMYTTQLQMLSTLNTSTTPPQRSSSAPPLTTVMSEYLSLCLQTAS